MRACIRNIRSRTNVTLVSSNLSCPKLRLVPQSMLLSYSLRLRQLVFLDFFLVIQPQGLGLNPYALEHEHCNLHHESPKGTDTRVGALGC